MLSYNTTCSLFFHKLDSLNCTLNSHFNGFTFIGLFIDIYRRQEGYPVPVENVSFV